MVRTLSVVYSFLKLAGYDRNKLVPGYMGRFVIHDHIAERAGAHFDLRLEFPVTSLSKALKNYEGKRIPGTKEPIRRFPNKEGSVYRSFAVRKHTIPTDKNKLFIVETEDHPIEYGNFSGVIPEGYGMGKVSIFDKGTFELLDVEGDKKYTIDFHGDKLKGIYSLIKYKNGYLWIKSKKQREQVRQSAVFYRGGPESSMPEGTAEDVIKYEQKVLGNQVHVMPGIDLKKIKAKDLLWVTEKKETAQEYGDVRPIRVDKYKIIARDNYGGLLIHIIKDKVASAIDYPRPTLPSDVWDLSLDPPRLKYQIKKRLLDVLDKCLTDYGFNNYWRWIEKLLISGSSTGHCYQEDGDLDIDIQFNPAKIKKIYSDYRGTLDKITKALRTVRNKKIAPDSERTFSFILVPYGDFPGSDGVYDILTDKWIKGPSFIPEEFDPDKAFVKQKQDALKVVHKIQSIIVNIRCLLKDLFRIDQYLKHYGDRTNKLISRRIIILSHIKELCDELVQWKRWIWSLQTDSKKGRDIHYPAFDFSTDWSDKYVTFKYIARYQAHEPVQLLYYEIQDTPYLDMIKKFMPSDAIGRPVDY